MPYTDPVRYPNALEQADPEGALNTYVIDNIDNLGGRVTALENSSGGGGDLTLLAATTGTATISDWVPVNNLFTSTYLNYKLFVDWLPGYSYPGDQGKMMLWGGSAPINSNHSGAYFQSGSAGGSMGLALEYLLTSAPSSYYYTDWWNHSEIDIAVPRSDFSSRSLVVNIKTISYNDDTYVYTLYQAGTVRNVSAEDSEPLAGRGVAFKPSATNPVDYRIRAYGYNSVLS